MEDQDDGDAIGHLRAKPEGDDSMSPRGIDRLVPPGESPRGHTLPGRLALAQSA